MQDEYFKGKKILITGITGFVGSHLSKHLSRLGATVYGISHTVKNKHIAKINIMNFEKVNSFIKDHDIEVCYHLAGESLVESGQRDPYHTFKVNTEGTLNILESARKNVLEKIIIASTAHVYGDNKLPYLESYTPKPSRPYETSKACTDLIAQSYADTFNLPVLVPRFVNIYGPGDLNFSRLIPKTIQSVLNGESPKMWGGEALRDYLFIEDALNAYIKLLSVPLKIIKDNRIFNFGSSNKASVEAIIRKIITISGKNLSITPIQNERPLEIEAQYVSSSKARRLLGWNPKIDLDVGLGKTIKWYTENR